MSQPTPQAGQTRKFLGSVIDPRLLCGLSRLLFQVQEPLESLDKSGLFCLRDDGFLQVFDEDVDVLLRHKETQVSRVRCRL